MTALYLFVLSSSLLRSAILEVPKRKPGLWEITTVAPVSGMTKIRICVGADDNLVAPEGDECAEPKLTLLNDSLIVDVACTGESGKQTISTAFTGDFQTRYHAVIKTTFDPPIEAIKTMGVIIDGKFLGADCAGGDETVKAK